MTTSNSQDDAGETSARKGKSTPVWVLILGPIFAVLLAVFQGNTGQQSAPDPQSASAPDEPALQVVLNDVETPTRTEQKPKTQSDSPANANGGSDDKTPAQADTPDKGKKPSLGKLREIGDKRYMSTAGLLYSPGSAEGHRLQHVMRHAKDDASRPIHGVFVGGYGEILAVIDEAYLIAKAKGRGVRTEQDRGRTVYTIPLGRKIGFMGGQAGKRQRNPPLQHIKLVLEGNRVITCFPLRP